MKYVILFLGLFAFYPQAADAINFVNLQTYIRNAGYTQCEDYSPLKRVKVAIFEKYFGEVDFLRGYQYPEDVELLFPAAHEENEQSIHGRYVAEVFHQYVSKFGNCPENVAEIYLIPSDGYSQFVQGIDKAIELGVDIILHNQVFDYLGNGDGTSFINNEVSRAVNAGITWVNPAGNFQNYVYSDSIHRMRYDNPELRFTKTRDQDKIWFSCTTKSMLDKCNLTVTLSWNDFQENVEEGSDKDLDLYVYDQYGDIVETIEDGKIIRGASSKFQTSDPELAKQSGGKAELYTYERVQLRISHGEYYVKIKDSLRSGEWSYQDRFRLAFDLDNQRIRLLDEDSSANTIYPPADNPNVITVGASDASESSHYAALSKPEIREVSKLGIEESEFAGSSIAATIFAAQMTLTKGLHPELSGRDLSRKTLEYFRD